MAPHWEVNIDKLLEVTCESLAEYVGDQESSSAAPALFPTRYPALEGGISDCESLEEHRIGVPEYL